MSDRKRRGFLQVLSGGALSVVAASGCGDNAQGDEVAASDVSGPVPAGNIAAVPIGTLRFVERLPLILGHDAGGLYAMTAICTHSACSIALDGDIQNGVISCRCHGAKFDSTGAVLRGPASRPLRHFQVDLTTTGDIVVQAGSEVPPTTRAVVSG